MTPFTCILRSKNRSWPCEDSSLVPVPSPTIVATSLLHTFMPQDHQASCKHTSYSLAACSWRKSPLPANRSIASSADTWYLVTRELHWFPSSPPENGSASDFVLLCLLVSIGAIFGCSYPSRRCPVGCSSAFRDTALCAILTVLDNSKAFPSSVS